MKIRIGSRTSPLALLQTNQVIDAIVKAEPAARCEIVKIESEGDLNQAPLHLIGGKGLFVEKLEQSMIAGETDMAVHSLKDVPAIMSNDFLIVATMQRENASDVMLLKDEICFKDLGEGSKIGTSGPRRKAQLMGLIEGLEIIPIRGNIQTRIKKIINGELDGLVMAKAALNRLQIQHPNTYYFNHKEMLPAAAQGAIGIQTHAASMSRDLKRILSLINHEETHLATLLEREVVACLDGGCLSPISVFCEMNQNAITIQVRVSDQEGVTTINHAEIFDKSEQNSAMLRIKNYLIESGAKELIQK